MNKYLEKIAARVKALPALRTGTDAYQLHTAVNKKKKAKPKVEVKGRKWNRGTVRKNA